MKNLSIMVILVVSVFWSCLATADVGGTIEVAKAKRLSQRRNEAISVQPCDSNGSWETSTIWCVITRTWFYSGKDKPKNSYMITEKDGELMASSSSDVKSVRVVEVKTDVDFSKLSTHPSRVIQWAWNSRESEFVTFKTNEQRSHWFWLTWDNVVLSRVWDNEENVLVITQKIKPAVGVDKYGIFSLLAMVMIGIFLAVRIRISSGLDIRGMSLDSFMKKNLSLSLITTVVSIIIWFIVSLFLGDEHLITSIFWIISFASIWSCLTCCMGRFFNTTTYAIVCGVITVTIMYFIFDKLGWLGFAWCLSLVPLGYLLGKLLVKIMEKKDKNNPEIPGESVA